MKMRYASVSVTLHDTEAGPLFENTLRESFVVNEPTDHEALHFPAVVGDRVEKSVRRLIEIDDQNYREHKVNAGR